MTAAANCLMQTKKYVQDHSQDDFCPPLGFISILGRKQLSSFFLNNRKILYLYLIKFKSTLLELKHSCPSLSFMYHIVEDQILSINATDGSV